MNKGVVELTVRMVRSAAVASLCAAAALSGAQGYRLIDLGPIKPEKRMMSVGGKGFEDLVIVGHADRDGIESPLLYSLKNSQVRWLDVLPHTQFALAYSVNKLGDAIGVEANGSLSHAVVWPHDGGMIDLGGNGAKAEGLNDLGTVVGQGPFERKSGGKRAVMWTKKDGMIDLAPRSASGGSAVAVNNKDQAAGWAVKTFEVSPGHTGGYNYAFRWSREQGFQWLPLPGDPTNSLVRAMNDAGVCVGHADYADGALGVAILWDAGGAPHTMGESGGRATEPLAINNHNVVVGYFMGGSTEAWMWTKEKGYAKLSDLVKSVPGWTFESANAIDDAGEISGLGTFKGQYHGFLLIPIKPVEVKVKPPEKAPDAGQVVKP